MTSLSDGLVVLAERGSLSSRRVLLVDFQPEESNQLALHLAARKCFSRAVRTIQIDPKASEIAGIDLILINDTGAPQSNVWKSAGCFVLTVRPDLGTLYSPQHLKKIEQNVYESILEDERPSKIRVLVSDDDHRISSLLAAVFRNFQYETFVANHGRQALQMARTIMPDLIYLDVVMPFVSGFDVLAEVRANPGTASAVVVMLSARGEQTDILRGSQLKADDYVVKPFSTLTVAARAKKLLMSRSQRLPPQFS